MTTYQYDPASQLTRLAHQLGAATINSFDYIYDKVGNRKSKADNNGTASYTYDTLNRLAEAINPLPTNPLESFNYDAVGNRISSNQNGASQFNQANQLLEDANFTYQYDNNGNLTLKTPKIPGPFTSYEYDAENKLVRAVVNGTTANYKYDGLGRRVEKEVISIGTTVTRFIYDNEDILLEVDGSNNITARYTHGPGIDEPLVMEKGGASFFYHADGLGSITELTDVSGVIRQRYTYSSFGKIESQLDPNFIQPYTFTAREFDPETGLFFYRARYYDGASGRFLSEDPINIQTFLRLHELLKRSSAGNTIAELLLKGFVVQPQNSHLFSYVRNNPITFIDPTGQFAQILGGIVGGAIAGGVAGAILGGVSTFVTSGGNLNDALAGALTGAVTGAIVGGVAGGFVAAGLPSLGLSAAQLAGSSLFGEGFLAGALSGEVAVVSSRAGLIAGTVGTILGPPVSPVHGSQISGVCR